MERNRKFSKEESQTASKHFQRRSLSLAISKSKFKILRTPCHPKQKGHQQEYK